MRSYCLMVVATLAVSCLFAPPALACGGLFCDGANPAVTVPPAQSAERIVFVLNPEGWTLPPEGLIEGGMVGPDGGPELDGGPTADAEAPPPVVVRSSVDAYIEIAYSGAAPGFAWVVPLLEPPTHIGTASKDLFELDAATAPTFTFTYTLPQAAFSGEGSGCSGIGCGAADSAPSSEGGGLPRTAPIPEVTVVSQQHVGPYEVAVITSERASALTEWLQQNKYRIPDFAEEILARYVAEGKYFAAFRLADGEGVGAIQPVVLRVPGDEPCIPLRMTPVASEPVLSVTALIFGAGRAQVRADSDFVDTAVDMTAVRPTSPTTTSYPAMLRQAARARQGRAFVTEAAIQNPSQSLAIALNGALAQIAGRSAFLTRLSTRIAPDEMSADPAFSVSAANQVPVNNQFTIDITDDQDAIDALNGVGIGQLLGVGGPGQPQSCAVVAPATSGRGRSGGGGDASLAAGLSVALFALLLSRRRAALARRR